MTPIQTHRKLRLLLTERCNRSCAGCCNHAYDLRALPILQDRQAWDEVFLTGGEPMLDPDQVIATAVSFGPAAKVYLYTAKVDDLNATLRVLFALDGMTLTLHEPSDVEPFLALNQVLLNASQRGWLGWSLRLNVFKGVRLPEVDLSLWLVHTGKAWIQNCPLPAGEAFMRLD